MHACLHPERRSAISPVAEWRAEAAVHEMYRTMRVRACVRLTSATICLFRQCKSFELRRYSGQHTPSNHISRNLHHSVAMSLAVLPGDILSVPTGSGSSNNTTGEPSRVKTIKLGPGLISCPSTRASASASASASSAPAEADTNQVRVKATRMGTFRNVESAKGRGVWVDAEEGQVSRVRERCEFSAILGAGELTLDAGVMLQRLRCMLDVTVHTQPIGLGHRANHISFSRRLRALALLCPLRHPTRTGF